MDFDRDVIIVERGDVRQAGHRVRDIDCSASVLGQHPEPVVGHARDRAAVAQRLRADDRPRRRRRRVAVRAAAGGARHRHPRGRQRDRRVGRHRRRHRRPALPRGHRLAAASRATGGDVFEIWQGGLGIPGGMLAGVLVGTWAGKRRGIPLGPGLNAVAPSLPLAQAIGRWGNYFNQELFGRPTTLPWALEIDAQHLPSNGQYPSGTTFHPTFLYESLWNLLLCGALLWIDRKFKLANGQLLAIYVLGYGDRPALGRGPAHRRGPPPWRPALEPVGGDPADRRPPAVGCCSRWGAPRERVYPEARRPAQHRPRRDRPRWRWPRPACRGDDAERRRSTLTTSRSTTTTRLTRRPTRSDDDAPTTGPATSDAEPQPTPDDSADEPNARRDGPRARAPVAVSKRCRRSGRGTRPMRSPGSLALRPSERATIGCVVTTSTPGSVQ